MVKRVRTFSVVPAEEPGPIRRALSRGHGVWVPAFAGTTSWTVRAPTTSHPPSLRLDGFYAHQVPELVDLVDEGLGLEDVGRLLVEPGVHDGLDAARPRRHHRHPVGQIDRL